MFLVACRFVSCVSLSVCVCVNNEKVVIRVENERCEVRSFIDKVRSQSDELHRIEVLNKWSKPPSLCFAL